MATPYNPTSRVVETYVVSRIQQGVEVPVTITEAWACKGRDPMTERVCNLVWQYRGQAIECAARGHRATYNQYYGASGEVSYPRTALNRKAAPVTPVPATPVVSELEAAMALVKAAGFRIQRAPQPKQPVNPAPQGDEDLPF